MQPGKRRRMWKLENKGAVRKSSKRSSKTNKITKTVDSVLGPGKLAPNFSLNSTPDQKVSLNDFRGQPVILAFYPADWSPVCTDQLSLYEMEPPLPRRNQPRSRRHSISPRKSEQGSGN